jgi:hypothetical protein
MDLYIQCVQYDRFGRFDRFDRFDHCVQYDPMDLFDQTYLFHRATCPCLPKTNHSRCICFLQPNTKFQTQFQKQWAVHSHRPKTPVMKMTLLVHLQWLYLPANQSHHCL